MAIVNSVETNLCSPSFKVAWRSRPNARTCWASTANVGCPGTRPWMASGRIPMVAALAGKLKVWRSASAGTSLITGSPIKRATNWLAGSWYNVCGESNCWITPSFNTIILSATCMASLWSCVTNTVVIPVSCWIRRISSRISTRRRASKFESGSSSNKTVGSFANARAIATRCCWPPDKAPGFLFSWSSTRTNLASSFALASRVVLSTLAIFIGKIMLSNTVICG